MKNIYCITNRIDSELNYINSESNEYNIECLRKINDILKKYPKVDINFIINSLNYSKEDIPYSNINLSKDNFEFDYHKRTDRIKLFNDKIIDTYPIKYNIIKQYIIENNIGKETTSYIFNDIDNFNIRNYNLFISKGGIIDGTFIKCFYIKDDLYHKVDFPIRFDCSIIEDKDKHRTIYFIDHRYYKLNELKLKYDIEFSKKDDYYYNVRKFIKL